MASFTVRVPAGARDRRGRLAGAALATLVVTVGLALPTTPASAASTFVATADLNGRDGPSLDSNVITQDEYRQGNRVSVTCQAHGEMAYGSGIWDRTSSGSWVPDAYVRTGTSGFAPGLPRCANAVPEGHYRFVARTELNGRTDKRLSAPTRKTYASGRSVTITCQALGETAYGSTIWERTTDGLWITDHYLKTGYDTFVPGVPRCADDASATPRRFPATADLGGRASKRVAAPQQRQYPKGSSVSITCQAYGEYAYGSAIWDKTSDGLWVPDAYVRTGTTGFVSAMPRCDTDAPSGVDPTGSEGSPTTGGGICDRVGHGDRPAPAGTRTGTTQQKIDRVIAAARSQTGKGLTYAWGGGGRSGPTCGIATRSPGGYLDYSAYGFDCSGFTQYAFWAGAGIDIGSDSSTQSLRGTVIPLDQAQAGDLLLWGSRGTTNHVALVVSGSRMLEAAVPRSSRSVHETPRRQADLAVRIF